ncbi:MAG: energy-coupling factor transporter ATPase [Firmicutes bacterium]|jgi:energy-coupling factor transport system ATP-binding protein|nr:energy-coupling factor transporter ATPase [Bacillota bacterium]
MSIEIRGLTHTYNPGTPLARTAIKDIDLTIEDGETVAIIGHTGSGKSTLVQHLNGLLKPTAGSVKVDGVDINQKGVDLRTIRWKVGLVFQYPEHQLFEETVWDDVAFGPRNMGLADEEVRSRVERALAAVDVDMALAERSPFELSGGEKRRVAIAGVLAMEPSVLVLDEPTAGLDPRGRQDMLRRIQRLQKERQLTVVFVSHNMAEVATLADRLIVMERGVIVMEGPPQAIFAQGEQLEAIGLGVPEMTALMGKLRAKGWDVPDSALTVEEAEAAIMAVLRREARVGTGGDI